MTTAEEYCRQMLGTATPPAKAPAPVGPLLSLKELSGQLKRGRGYVHAMKRAGFPMAGNRARLAAAEAWLADHPGFRRSQFYPSRPKAEHRGTSGNT
jgi:hypothetical protein